MKKKGLSFIELLIVLFLSTIAMGIGVVSINLYKNIKLKVSYEEMKVGLLSFFDEASLYCLNNEVQGDIMVYSDNDVLKFVVRSSIIMKYSMEDDLKFKDAINSSNKLSINTRGEIIGSGTVRFDFKNKIQGELVISAITANVKIREKQR